MADNYIDEQPQYEFPSEGDFDGPAPAGHEGGSRSPLKVESLAGRKPGFAKRTAGAKSQATRAALGGFEKKHSARSVEKKLTGPQKAGRQKRRAAKKRAVAQERKRKSGRVA